MEKILRLSLFNLKKNKKEAIAIAFLTLVSTMMLGIFAINVKKVSTAFDDSFKQSGSHNTFIAFNEDEYRYVYEDILAEEYDVETIDKCNYLIAWATNVIQGDDKIAYNLTFITENDDRKMDGFCIIESLSDEDLESIEHPIWLPSFFKYNAGFASGENFSFINAGREYPFTIAGFYNTGISNSTGMTLKCVITQEDYRLIKPLFTSYTLLGFDIEERMAYSEYLGKCMDESGDSINDSRHFDMWDEKSSESLFLNMFLYMSIALSLITFVASIFMIRNKIKNDIEDQMETIGVLEALGYQGKEISASYVFEYVISSGTGGIIGGIIALLVTPLMDNVIRVMIGREVVTSAKTYLVIPVVIGVLGLILLFALTKASMVKRFPPVVAFRRGIHTHNFRRNLLPLEKLKSNINAGLAFKDAVKNIRAGAGVGLCIFLAGTALVFCMFTFVFFFHGSDKLATLTGLEISDDVITLNEGVDAYEISEQILAMPEVRRTEVSYLLPTVRVKDSQEAAVIIYDDFDDVEWFSTMAGRFPEHDNEVVISLQRSRRYGQSVGDTLVIDRNGVLTSYIITGIVGAMSNNQMNLYLTSAGYRRANGCSLPNTVEIFLEDGVNREKFEQKLVSIYGISAEDAMASESSDGTLEERIRTTAEEKMAVLISQYGITSVDYAVRVGDQLITGNSRQFVIKNIQSYRDLVKSQLDPISGITRTFTFIGVIAIGIVVAVILGIIASSNVKRKRKDLGIMKSLGYSSRDLMIQMAISIMPVTVISVILASEAAMIINRIFWLELFGANAVADVPVLILTDLALIVFTFVMTYIGAGKIKKISVTELMTE